VTTNDEETDLRRRRGLPPVLRATLLKPERAAWEAAPRSIPADHWLGIHRSLRQESAALIEVLRWLADDRGSSGDPPYDAALRQARAVGGQLLGHTEAHHNIEDVHYFPRFVQVFPQLGRAIALLDSDHHVIEATLETLGHGIGLLRRPLPDRDAVGRLLDAAGDFAAILGRHLADEEDIVVPVLMRMR
jgi:hypothetical protein